MWNSRKKFGIVRILRIDLGKKFGIVRILRMTSEKNSEFHSSKCCFFTKIFVFSFGKVWILRTLFSELIFGISCYRQPHEQKPHNNNVLDIHVRMEHMKNSELSEYSEWPRKKIRNSELRSKTTTLILKILSDSEIIPS
jgi:hypothetical protein